MLKKETWTWGKIKYLNKRPEWEKVKNWIIKHSQAKTGRSNRTIRGKSSTRERRKSNFEEGSGKVKNYAGFTWRGVGFSWRGQAARGRSRIFGKRSKSTNRGLNGVNHKDENRKQAKNINIEGFKDEVEQNINRIPWNMRLDCWKGRNKVQGKGGKIRNIKNILQQKNIWDGS